MTTKRQRKTAPGPPGARPGVSGHHRVAGRVSGHSLRVGSAQSLAAAGAGLVELQEAGDWQAPHHAGARGAGAKAPLPGGPVGAAAISGRPRVLGKPRHQVFHGAIALDPVAGTVTNGHQGRPIPAPGSFPAPGIGGKCVSLLPGCRTAGAGPIRRPPRRRLAPQCASTHRSAATMCQSET